MAGMRILIVYCIEVPARLTVRTDKQVFRQEARWHSIVRSVDACSVHTMMSASKLPAERLVARVFWRPV